MSILYYLNVTVHVLSALLWLGGMFFLAAVGAPVLRRVEPPALRAELFQRLGSSSGAWAGPPSRCWSGPVWSTSTTAAC